jgi:hypothetical protein
LHAFYLAPVSNGLPVLVFQQRRMKDEPKSRTKYISKLNSEIIKSQQKDMYYYYFPISPF